MFSTVIDDGEGSKTDANLESPVVTVSPGQPYGIEGDNILETPLRCRKCRARIHDAAKDSMVS